jgi:4-amino-4-deoxy-L-arabinose transferase-like glycosyltransferase
MTQPGTPWWRRLWSSHAPVVVLAAIIVVGVVERLYRFTAPILDQHFFRQTQTASQVWLWDRFGFSFLDYHVPMFGGGYWVLEYPWYQAVVYALSLVFGFHEELGRVVSIAAFVASAYLLYEIGRRLLGSRAAAIASVAFLAFMPITVFYYRAFLIDPFIITFALLMVLAALRLSERITWPWMGVFLGATFVTALGKTNLIVVFALPVLTLLYRAFVMKRAARAQWAALVGGAVVILVAVIAWTRHADAINLASNGMTYGNMRWWYFGSRIFDASLWTTIGERFVDNLSPVGIVMVGLGLSAIPRLRSGYRLEVALLALSVPISISIFANLNIVHDYYQLPYYPTLSLLGGLGVWSVASLALRVSRPAAFQLAAGLMIGLIGIWSYTLFVGTFFSKDAIGALGNRDIGQVIQVHTPDKPIVTLGEGDDPREPTVLYEARRIGWRLNSLDPAGAKAQIAKAPELGAIVVFKGPTGVPSWVLPAGAARGLTPAFESPQMLILAPRAR